MLVDITAYIPNILLNLRYTTTNNFTSTIVDTNPLAQVLEPVAQALAKVQNEIAQDGYTLVIWSAYRSTQLQVKLLSTDNDSAFVSKISNHTRGIAVDITLARMNTGTLLEMPTEFDTFSLLAAPTASDISDVAAQYRDYLLRHMKQENFEVYSHEWLHFDYTPLLNVPCIDSNYIFFI